MKYEIKYQVFTIKNKTEHCDWRYERDCIYCGCYDKQ